jgi:exonuclease VII small subunit
MDQDMTSEEDPILVKQQLKQARMIRNRQSAAASRKRKQDLVTKLQQHVSTLEKENADLKRKLEAYERSQATGVDGKRHCIKSGDPAAIA